MKHLTLILLFCLGCVAAASAQMDEGDKSEYRYWGIIIGLNHGFSAPENTNENVMLHTPKGDMYKTRASGFSYTPGYQIGAVYNLDFKNNKSGIQTGLEFTNYGCRTKYETRDNNLPFDMKESFRAMAVSVPLLFKFGASDIYRNMTYVTLGVRAHYNISVMQGQKADWNSQKYGKKLTGDEINQFSVCGVLGFNAGMFSLNANYMFMNFINDGCQIIEDGITKKPFEGIKGGLYIYTSLNVPMCRWLTVHNWQAEKIRRKLHGGSTF
ncbi:MAG: outer membrane beta-barrel protein [Bacteroidales bacterium]|nr:outer membrane beta-barrel protein [Bacteroidales bacterium]